MHRTSWLDHSVRPWAIRIIPGEKSVVISSDRLIYLIDLAMAKRAPALISRSGPAAEAIDCFVIHFQLDGHEYNIDTRHGDLVKCRRWLGREEGGFIEPAELSIYDVLRGRPEIRHFYGIYDLTWSSWESFSWEQRHHWTYVQLAISKCKAWLSSERNRFKKVVTVERYTALKAVWELQLIRDQPVSSIAVISHIHGIEIFSHPLESAVSTRMRLVLKSLVDTGELKQPDSVSFVLTGGGLSSLERVEEEDRKHRDAMRIQRRMVWLTLILMLSAIVQADLVDLPTLLKIDRWPWQRA